MNLRHLLRNIWEAVAYGPQCPVPEIRQKLEEKGYKYVEITDSTYTLYGGFAAHLCTVFNKEGKRVHYNWSDEEASREFRKDYDQAIAERRAPRP